MQPDLLVYDRFYKGPLGQCVTHILSQYILAHYSDFGKSDTLCLGYGIALCEHLRNMSMPMEHVMMMMPSAMGVCPWLVGMKNRSALVEPYRLPLADSSLQHVLLIHSLEHVGHPQKILREIWRVLKPSGQVMIIVPNRRRAWSTFELTPFAYGQPFSKSQLCHMMIESLLSPVKEASVMMMPPLPSTTACHVINWMEKPLAFINRKLGAHLGGLLMVHATKEVYGMIKGKKAKIFAPAVCHHPFEKEGGN